MNFLLKKNFFSSFLLFAVLLHLCSCGFNNQNNLNLYNCLGFVTNTYGISNSLVNKSVWDGLKKAEKVLGYQLKYIESSERKYFKSNIKYFTDCDLDILFCSGFEMADEVYNIASTYPDKYYVMVNYIFPEQLDNVFCIEFEDQQVAYQAGYLAGFKTKTNKVGFIGNVKSNIISAFEFGFKAGVFDASKQLDKDIYVEVQYIDNFYHDGDSIEIEKKVADKMFQDGIDIIFYDDNQFDNGVIEAAKENNQFVICSDVIKDEGDLIPGCILASTMRIGIDNIVFDIAKKIKDTKDVKTVMGNSQLLGLKEDAIKLEILNKPEVDDNLIDKLNEIESKIKIDKLDPPYDEESFNEFIELDNSLN